MQIAKRILKKLEGIKLCDWTGKYGVWILWNVIIAANLAPWVVANNNISNKSEETQSIWKESAHTLNFTSTGDIISIDSECIIWKKVFSIYIHCLQWKHVFHFQRKNVQIWLMFVWKVPGGKFLCKKIYEKFPPDMTRDQKRMKKWLTRLWRRRCCFRQRRRLPCHRSPSWRRWRRWSGRGWRCPRRGRSTPSPADACFILYQHAWRQQLSLARNNHPPPKKAGHDMMCPITGRWNKLGDFFSILGHQIHHRF